MSASRSVRGITRGGAVLAAALLSLPALAAEVDPFYQRLLEEGVRAYERGDHGRAREELRIAAFGLLETPEQLARALAHLALAQSATGHLEGFAHTYGRLTEIESRFRAYSAAALGPDLRSALDQAARSHLGTALAAAEPAAGESPATSEQTAGAPRTRLCISWTGNGECGQPPSPEEPPSPNPSPKESEPNRDDQRFVQRVSHHGSAGW